ncbi:hypothetical protein HC928_13750 [bacterium]|nr:hypothetical protein [bacterium]
MAAHDKHDREPVILGGARLPQGRFLGALSSLTAAELGQIAVQAAVERSGIDTANVDEVLIGTSSARGRGRRSPGRLASAQGCRITSVARRSTRCAAAASRR